MAKPRQPQNQLMPAKRSKLPEYGELTRIMQSETASIITDYIRQWVGVASQTPEPGSGIFINWDRVLRTQSYQELAWYELYQEVERDPHVSAVMANAKLNVAGMRWDIEPHIEADAEKPTGRNDAIAKFVRHVLQNTGYFPQHIYNLMDAVGKGFSVSEIIWQITDEGVIIKEIINRPQRRFQFDAVDRSLKLRNLQEPYYGIPLPDKKFIVHRISAQWENPFGDALDQSLYWMWLFKKTVMKFWMQHLQVGASSIPIVKHPVGANDKFKAEALQIAEMIRNGAYGRIPENFEIIFAEAKNTVQNATVYNEFIRMVNDEIAKCVNGQTLTTEASSVTGTGTQALGNVHQGTQNARDLFRAHGIEATLNSTLVKWLVDFNFGEVDGYPQFRFDLEAPEDLAGEAAIVKTLTDAGFEFDEQEISEKFNWTVTKKKQQEAPPSGPEMPGGGPTPPEAQDGAEEPTDQVKKDVAAKAEEAKAKEKEFGGAGSGNWGHAGRPGERGGSLAGSSYKHGRFEGLTMLDDPNIQDHLNNPPPAEPKPPEPAQPKEPRRPREPRKPIDVKAPPGWIGKKYGGDTGKAVTVYFDSQPTTHQDRQIRRALKDVPDRDRPFVKMYVNVSKASLYSFKGKDGRTYNAVADYHIASAKMRVAGLSYTTTSNIVHEFGHNAYYKTGNVDLLVRAKWDQLWRANKVQMPTDYARSEPEEGFAEAYMHYHHGTPHGARGPWKDRPEKANISWVKFFKEHKL